MLRIKVCGLQNVANAIEVSELNPDFMGFIFFPRSPRYALRYLDCNFFRSIPSHIKKVGVFVKPNKADVINYTKLYDLQLVQLHHSSPELVNDLERLGIHTISVFSVDETFSPSVLEAYKASSYFLFDTKSENLHGGTGKNFRREIIYNLNISKPYFIAGGVDLNEIMLSHAKIFAYDVNSKFEVSPGIKDINKLRVLMNYINGNEFR